MSSSIEWQQVLWMLAYAGPTFLVWCGAITFCFLRRRENPKGAMLLSLATLTQFCGMIFSYIVPTISRFYGVELYTMAYFRYVHLAVSVGTSALSWILVTMAVFARPMHYDFSSGPMFEDEA